MIKKQSLTSMASFLTKSCLINNDPCLNYLRKPSTTPNYGTYRTPIRFNLSNCGDNWDKDHNFKCRKDNGGVDVDGFCKMRALALSKDPVSEMGLRGVSIGGGDYGNNGGDGVNEFCKMTAFALSKDPVSEIGLRGVGVGGGCGGYSKVCHRDGSTGFSSGPCLPEKVSVAVDVDEVLGNFVSALNRFIADRYLSKHSVSEYYVYEFFKIWKCSRDEADVRVHEFFKTLFFKNGIHPIPGAQNTLQKLQRFCNLSIVTSRQNVIKDHTIEWIEKHYPGLFEEIHFGNHFALDGESKSKAEICRLMGAKVLIDDNPRYALECAEVGIKVLLFDYENSYPWCKTGSSYQHPLMTKVHNWVEVEQQLVSWVFFSCL